MNVLFGILLILHGLVHLLYYGQANRFFELQPEMKWPEQSWLFEPVFGKNMTCLLAGIFCILSAVGFIAGGIAIFSHNTGWKTVVIIASVFSSLLYLLFWDRTYEKLKDQGAIAILINAALLISLLFFGWPDFG